MKLPLMLKFLQSRIHKLSTIVYFCSIRFFCPKTCIFSYFIVFHIKIYSFLTKLFFIFLKFIKTCLFLLFIYFPLRLKVTYNTCVFYYDCSLYYHLCAFCNTFNNGFWPQYFAPLWMQLCHNLEGDCREEFWDQSVSQFSCSVMSNSLRPHGPQHARPPCPSTLGVHPNPCPLSWWCHPTISSSVIPFFSCLQSFPASGAFPMSWFFASDGQSIEVSASTSVLPMNTQDWSPSGWTGWISLQSKGL